MYMYFEAIKHLKTKGNPSLLWQQTHIVNKPPIKIINRLFESEKAQIRQKASVHPEIYCVSNMGAQELLFCLLIYCFISMVNS